MDKDHTPKEEEKESAKAEGDENGISSVLSRIRQIRQEREAKESPNESPIIDPGHHFKIISAHDLVHSDIPEPEWIWDQVIPVGGSVIVAAKPKVGKTVFSLNLGIAICRGDVFLGRKTKQTKVLYLALESNDTLMKQSLTALGVDEEPFSLHVGMAPKNAIKELRPLIRQTEAGVIVIDILQKFARTKQINDYSEVTNTLEEIFGTCMQENCCAIVNHHSRKDSGKEDEGDDILGSTGLEGGVDAAIIIRKIDFDRQDRFRRRVFSTVNRYGEAIPKTILTMLSNGSLINGGTLEEAKQEELNAVILNVLDDTEKAPWTWKKIRGQVRKSDSLVLKSLHNLVEKCQLKKSGIGSKTDPFVYEKM